MFAKPLITAIAAVILAAPAHAGEQAVVTCCDDASANDLVVSYLKVQRGLAGKGRVSSTIYLMRGTVSAARSRSDSDEEKAVLDGLYAAVDAVKNKSEDGIRGQFAEISRFMTWVIYAHESPDGEHKLVEGVCEDGSSWWQAGKTAKKSPFEGSCELR